MPHRDPTLLPGWPELESQAYNRLAWGKPTLLRYHRIVAKIPPSWRIHSDKLFAWFLVPITLWPFDIQDALQGLLDDVESRRKTPGAWMLAVELLPEPPNASVIATTVVHEHQVQHGEYENFTSKVAGKFSATQEELRESTERKADWAKICREFAIEKFRDHKGVIRRVMIPERNLQPGTGPKVRRKSERFWAVFNAYCQKWNLYGMQYDDPLLLKLSVNLTPFGTMVFIPAFWSLDWKRDFSVERIAELHRARVPKRQGQTQSEGREHRRKQAQKLQLLDEEAKQKKLRGQKKHEFLCQGLGLHPVTDPRQFSRLRKEFAKE
jgi:hypothetical protein